MKNGGALAPGTVLRRAAFEDVPEMLRVIGRALERGSVRHYGREQRRAVYLGYATGLYVEVIGGFDTVVAEQRGRLVGFAQLDAQVGRLRALFVDAPAQGRGLGGVLLAAIVEQARRRGCARLHGAMSLNAVGFYSRAGFRRCPGTDRLVIVGTVVPVVTMDRWVY
jgi:GNAT superfamily N-acetyltransferase